MKLFPHRVGFPVANASELLFNAELQHAIWQGLA